MAKKKESPAPDSQPEIFDAKKLDPKIVSWFDDRFYKINYDTLPKNVREKYPEKNGIDFLPSVTTILGAAPKEWLGKWRGQVGNWEANRIMEEAATKGEHIHRAANCLLTGGIIIFQNLKSPAYSTEEINAIIAEHPHYYIVSDQQEALELDRFTRLIKALRPRIVASEVKVFSLAYDYAGTIDIIADIEAGSYEINCNQKFLYKGRYIIDIKTGNQDEESQLKQLAAYMVAYEEMQSYYPSEVGSIIDGTINVFTNTKNKKEIEGLKTVVFNREENLNAFNNFLNLKAVYKDHLDYKPKVLDLPTIFDLRGSYDC